MPRNGGNLIGMGGSPIDPLLGPLADNGGPTATHALLIGSPAIDMGDPNAVAGAGGVPQFDQRGAPFTRVHGAQIDMGAFELQRLPEKISLIFQPRKGSRPPFKLLVRPEPEFLALTSV